MDHAEQGVDLAAGERRGGLVQDQQAGVLGEGLGDLDELLAGDAELADWLVEVDVQADPVQGCLGDAAHLLAVDHAEPLGGAAQRDVLGDAELRHQVQLLVDGGDAVALGGLDVGELDGLAVDEDAAGVRLVDAGHHLDQRGLAGAVLAEEHLDLAGADLHGDVVDDGDRAEGFAHPLEGEQCGLRISHGGGPRLPWWWG